MFVFSHSETIHGDRKKEREREKKSRSTRGGGGEREPSLTAAFLFSPVSRRRRRRRRYIDRVGAVQRSTRRIVQRETGHGHAHGQ